MMLILKPEASRPFALNKNNFKRCIRTTVSKWMRLIISIFIVQLSFILPKYQIYENMTLNQDHSNPRAHISSEFLVNCTSPSPDNLFIPVFTSFSGLLQSPIFLKPPSWRLWRGARPEGWATRLAAKKGAKVRFYFSHVNYAAKTGMVKNMQNIGGRKLNNASLKIARH